MNYTVRLTSPETNMCGIIGYIGYRDVVPVLIQGLEQLEYRGYDSAGIACLDSRKGNLFLAKEKGKLAALKEKIGDFNIDLLHIGVGHTRWATHGEPSRENAHPTRILWANRVGA